VRELYTNHGAGTLITTLAQTAPDAEAAIEAPAPPPPAAATPAAAPQARARAKPAVGAKGKAR
jgi:hypothetical protein